jgi:ADP-ribose pyrophosphatase
MLFEVLKSQTVYQGRAFNVRRDEVRLPGGRLARLDIVDHPGAVTLVPVDDGGRILFVRQFRYAVQEDLLELPAGTLEQGESPEVCALREVREETGMSADQLMKLGEFFLAPGYSTEYMHIYLLTGLKSAPLEGDADEFISVEPLRIEQAFELARSGVIRDAKSISALFLAQPFLEKMRR